MPCEASPHTTGHGQRPPTGFCYHRQCILPVGTIQCRSALFFAKMASLAGRLLCICFCRYFKTAVLLLAPLHTRVWRDLALGSLSCKLYKTKAAIQRRLVSWLQGERLQTFQRERTQREALVLGLGFIHISYLSFSLFVFQVFQSILLHTNTQCFTFLWLLRF